MDNRRILIEYLKCIDSIEFTEQENGECIGVIHDNIRDINVFYRADNLGQYLELSYITECVGSAQLVQECLYRWFVNGRFEIKGDSVRLYSIIPILNETYLPNQIRHAIDEIWDMFGVVKSDFNKKEL